LDPRRRGEEIRRLRNPAQPWKKWSEKEGVPEISLAFATLHVGASSIEQAAGMMLVLPSPAQSSRGFILERGSLSPCSLGVCIKGAANLDGNGGKRM
jgi:hypothetical protein